MPQFQPITFEEHSDDEWVYNRSYTPDSFDIEMNAWDIYELECYYGEKTTPLQRILHLYNTLGGSSLDQREKALRRDGRWSSELEEWFAEARRKNTEKSLASRKTPPSKSIIPMCSPEHLEQWLSQLHQRKNAQRFIV